MLFLIEEALPAAVRTYKYALRYPPMTLDTICFNYAEATVLFPLRSIFFCHSSVL